LSVLALCGFTIGAPPVLRAQAHQSIFISAQEAAAMRAALGKNPLLDRSVDEARKTVDSALAHPIDVPQPGEAGGYAHERHKQNYREMEQAGLLFAITRDARYARFVRAMLDKYAVLYPTLGPHPMAKNQAPGKLFHQSLNEANWLLATAIAYDCVYDWLAPSERARFEANIFRPMADWLSVAQAKEFDRIHNHGTWATAAVGAIGYVMGDSSYVNRALYGTKRNHTGGFLRQLNLLFSPDGYYMEGPYYVRYALLPFFQFAEAINRRQPALRIYEYRNQILKKALYSALETSFPNGIFPPINDASRTMAIDAPEVVLALDLAYKQYGANESLLGAAAIQNEVILNSAGLEVAKEMARHTAPPRMSWGSVEFTDGPIGENGGLGILRAGKGTDATMLLMKYGVHGGGHGHFDQLHFILFDGGREVVPDYGFSRWINIEPKSGGRYLPENDTYAMQTIAHNTVVVDQASQSEAKEDSAEAVSGQRNFFSAANPSIQAMSARANRQYPGVSMQRTMFLIRDARLAHPVVVDLYRLSSSREHSYDYPIHFRGQLISTNVRYSADSARQLPVGNASGYQHIWKEASGPAPQPVQMTWLDGNRYYSVTTAAGDGAQVFFGRTGANDPNFNLIAEPLMIVRKRASDQLFASAIEPHGYFSEPEERSEQARPKVQQVKVLSNDADASVIEVSGEDQLRWTVMVSNSPLSATAHHRVSAAGRTYEWTGNYAVQGVQPLR
jgi:oligo-alginate lyase